MLNLIKDAVSRSRSRTHRVWLVAGMLFVTPAGRSFDRQDLFSHNKSTKTQGPGLSAQ